jgi:Tfp pilus assembly protein PilZ
VSSRKSSKRILKPEILTKDFDKDIEEAKTLLDIERLEKKDTQLWFLAIFMILLLTLFIVAVDFSVLNVSPGEMWKSLTAFRLSMLIFPAAILLLAFCGYVFSQKRKFGEMRRQIFIHKVKLERARGSMEEVVALAQISSAINNHKEFTAILEMIGRESLNCLKAHRSTVFLLEEKSGILKTQFTFTSDSLHEQVGLFEEKEMARKALRQKRPFLLREPGDFSDFLKYQERDRKITSLISIPLAWQEKSLGALTAVILDDDRKFTERDLQFLVIFGNQVSIAMETSTLGGEVRKGVSFRKNYEQYLDNILNQLQSLSDVERRRIEDHIGKLLPASILGANPPLSEQNEEVVKGTLPVAEQAAFNQQADERVTKMLQVDVEGEPPAISQDLDGGGFFIRTPNPLDLGEEFLLKLHLVEGEKPIEVECKVIWTNKYGKESRTLRRGMGVKFLNLSPEIQSRVETYIQSHKNQQFSFAEDQHRLSLGD